MSKYDLKKLTQKHPPCRRCQNARRLLLEAYARGVRDEHDRWEALEEQQAHDRLRAAFRRRMHRDRACLRAIYLLTTAGMALLAALVLGATR